ncbi:MAG: PDZ domain-containing protein [Acidimicrobiia bacterium]
MNEHDAPDQSTGDQQADAEAPTVPSSPDAPTVAAGPESPPPYGGGASADSSPPQHGSGRGWIWGGVAAVVVVVLVVGAYFVGRSSVDQGPASLSEAAQQTAKGELPVGDVSLSALAEALGDSKGDLLEQLGLGGKGSASNSIVQDLLDELGDQLKDRVQDGLSGKRDSGSSDSSTSRDAFFGVSTTNSSNPAGAQISAVRADSPAADAGLQAGDVITAIDGTTVASSSSFARQVASHDPGDVISVTYARGGTSATARVRLGNTSTPTTTTSPAI